MCNTHRKIKLDQSDASFFGTLDNYFALKKQPKKVFDMAPNKLTNYHTEKFFRQTFLDKFGTFFKSCFVESLCGLNNIYLNNTVITEYFFLLSTTEHTDSKASKRITMEMTVLMNTTPSMVLSDIMHILLDVGINGTLEPC